MALLDLAMKSIAVRTPLAGVEDQGPGHTVWDPEGNTRSSGSQPGDFSRDLRFAKQTGEEEESQEPEGRLSGRQIMQEILKHCL